LDHSHIELKGLQITSLTRTATGLCIAFSWAAIIKRMSGSQERTRWWQAGALILENLASEPWLPAGPWRCIGGTIDENIYSYRDLIPIPFISHGQIRCLLQLEGQDRPLVVESGTVRLELEGVARYIEHLRA